MLRPDQPHQASGCESRRGKHAGAPRSRLRAWIERFASERSVESPQRGVGPAGGEQSFGPNGSEPLQPREIGAERRGSRARHVGVKATDWVSRSGAAQDPSGVREAARSDSLMRNRRDPTWWPTSGKGLGYKPSAKCPGAGRESEGLIVLKRPGETWDEGRSPALVARARGGKCEGMV
jgi:hypothetical protein